MWNNYVKPDLGCTLMKSYLELSLIEYRKVNAYDSAKIYVLNYLMNCNCLQIEIVRLNYV